MSFDASNYSSLGRRRTSYSLSSGSNRSSFSADYGSSSYGFSPGLSSLGSSSSPYSASGRYSSRPPPAPSFSSHTSREGSFLSTSMMKRDSIINSLVRTSHDLNRHDFLPADAASMRAGSSHVSHSSYKPLERSRSRTDLSLSSFTARPSSDLGCFTSYTTTSGYGTTYRSTYRPILIQRPTFDNYTPRPREERQRNAHFKSIRRDRPLVKFREKEDDVDPEKVKQLLDSWSPETIEEHDEDDYETRKRDSVRSNDSGIGSFRSSFGKRSYKKSGEFLTCDLSPTIDEKDSGTEDNEDMSSDRRYGRCQKVDHVSSVDEGVHMDADYESRSPRDIVSPLGFHDNMNCKPFSRNDIQNVLRTREIVHPIKLEGSLTTNSDTLGTSTIRKDEKYPVRTQISSPVMKNLSNNSEALRTVKVQNEEKDLSSPEIKAAAAQSLSKNSETLLSITVKNKEICSSNKEVVSPDVQNSIDSGILRTKTMEQCPLRSPKNSETGKTSAIQNKEHHSSELETKSPDEQKPSRNSNIARTLVQNEVKLPADIKSPVAQRLAGIPESLKTSTVQNEESSGPEVKSQSVRTRCRNSETLKLAISQNKEQDAASPELKSAPVQEATRSNNRVRRRSDVEAYKTPGSAPGDSPKILSNQNEINRMENFRSRLGSTGSKNDSIYEVGNVPRKENTEINLIHKDEVASKRHEESSKIRGDVNRMNWRMKTAPNLSNAGQICKTIADSSSQFHVADVLSGKDDKTEISKSEKDDLVSTTKDTVEKIKTKKKVKKLDDEEKKTMGLKNSSDLLSKTGFPETDSNANNSGKAPNETLSPDFSAEKRKFEHPAVVKQILTVQTHTEGAQDLKNNKAKPTDECFKSSHPRLENSSDLKNIGTSDLTEKNTAVTKIKEEKRMKTDISLLDENKCDVIDSEKVLRINKYVRQEKKHVAASVSDVVKVNNLESVHSPMKVIDSSASTVNEVKVPKLKETVQADVSSKFAALNEVKAQKVKEAVQTGVSGKSANLNELQKVKDAVQTEVSKSTTLNEVKAQKVKEAVETGVSGKSANLNEVQKVKETVQKDVPSKSTTLNEVKALKVKEAVQTGVSGKSSNLNEVQKVKDSVQTEVSKSTTLNEVKAPKVKEAVQTGVSGKSATRNEEQKVKETVQKDVPSKSTTLNEVKAQKAKEAVQTGVSGKSANLNEAQKVKETVQKDVSPKSATLNEAKLHNVKEAVQTGVSAKSASLNEVQVKEAVQTDVSSKSATVNEVQVPKVKEAVQIDVSSKSATLNDVKAQEVKETVQSKITSKSDTISSKCGALAEKIKAEEPSSEERDNKQDISSEKIPAKCLDIKNNNLKSADLKTQPSSPSVDKSTESSSDTKPPPKAPKQKNNIFGFEEKPKFGFALLKSRPTTEKTLPYSQQKLPKTQANDKQHLDSGDKLASIPKDALSPAKDGLKNKIEKESNKDSKTSLEAKDEKAVAEMKENKDVKTSEPKTQRTEFLKHSVSSEDKNLKSKCSVPIDVEKGFTQEKDSVSESCFAEISTKEGKKADVLSETSASKDSSENKNLSAKEYSKQSGTDTQVSLENKRKISFPADDAEPKTNRSISKSEPSETKPTYTKSKEMTNHQTESTAGGSDDNVTVATSVPETKDKKSNKSPYRISKSSSEDFRHDETNSLGQTADGSFKLQKSSSADIKVLTHAKPPLPFKAVLPPGLPLRRREPATPVGQRLEKNNTFHKLQKSSTSGKLDFKENVSETQKLHDLKKSYTTECSRLVRKPPTKDAKVVGKSSCFKQAEIQTRKVRMTEQNSNELKKMSDQTSLESPSAKPTTNTLQPKDTKILELSISKGNAENSGSVTSARPSAESGAFAQKTEVCGTSQVNETKTEVIKSSQTNINEALISVKGSHVPENSGKDFPELPPKTISEESTLASLKMKDESIPSVRVARPYAPKNRLVPSKSDTNVPLRQLMTSASAPNIAVEQMRVKLAKKIDLSGRLILTAKKLIAREPAQCRKEHDLLSVTEVNDTPKTNQIASEIKIMTPVIDTQTENSSVLASKRDKDAGEQEVKDKQQILAESPTSEPQKDTKSEQSSQSVGGPSKLEASKTKNRSDDRTHIDLNVVKGDLKDSSAKVSVLGIESQVQIKTEHTESIEVHETAASKTESTQNASPEQNLEQLVIRKTAAADFYSEQISVVESVVRQENVNDSLQIGRLDDNKAAKTTVPAKQENDTAGTMTLDAKGATEEIKLKPKKPKKPKVEGEELTVTVKKKKKKKEKVDANDAQSVAKEAAQNDKSSEGHLISVPADNKQGLSQSGDDSLESNLQSSSDTNRNFAQECGTESLKATATDCIHSEQCTDLATPPCPGVTSETPATTDTSAVNNVCSPTTPQSPVISDPEDVCDHAWSENKRSESTESIRRSRNSSSVSPATLRYKKYCVEDFHFLKVLGRGSYGKVMLAELKGGKQYFAVKCLKKDVVLEDNDVECTMIEKKVLAMGSNHPYLCTLFSTFQSPSHLFFVMEYLSGGDLMFHIQQSGRFDQERARFYAAEIVCALKYLHKRGIVYRDAKLDNICLDSDGHIRLVDFGFCKLRIYRKECLPRNLCGTPDYMAPEIIKGLHYNQSVDWWSFGVLLYEMLIGQSPFNGTDEEELFWSVCNEDAYYPRFISKEAKQLLVLLLEKNPEKRLGMPGCTAGDISHQPFFRLTNWEKVEKKEVEPPFRPKLKSETDVSNFDSDFTMEKAMLTPIDKQILDSMDQMQFSGFSYTNPHVTD